MFRLAKNVRIMPCVFPAYPKANNLFITEHHAKMRQGMDENMWLMQTVGVTHHEDSGRYESLDAHLKAKNLNVMSWLDGLVTEGKPVDVFLNWEDWVAFYVTYLIKFMPKASVEHVHRIYTYTLSWISIFLKFLSEKQNAEAFVMEQLVLAKDVMCLEDFTVFYTECRNKHKKVFPKTNSRPFELDLARYFTGKLSRDLDDFVKELYYTEMRSLLVGLDFILTFKGKRDRLTQVQWDMLYDIVADAQRIEKYSRSELMLLRKINAEEFDLGEEDPNRFYPEGSWIDGLVASETSGEMRLYLIGPDKYATSVNSYVLCDILAHKDDEDYLKHFG